MNPIAVFTTVGKREEARAIARSLVERRLAACVQISEIESYYTWQGNVQNDREYRLLIKTNASRYDAVEAAIRELHSYELPAIHSLEFQRAFPPYAKWIEENSQGLDG